MQARVISASATAVSNTCLCIPQVGCGADELIDLLMRCVLDPGDTIVDCPPTFTMYAFDAAVNGASVITVPRLDGFRIDVPGPSAALHHLHLSFIFTFRLPYLTVVCCGFTDKSRTAKSADLYITCAAHESLITETAVLLFGSH